MSVFLAYRHTHGCWLQLTDQVQASLSLYSGGYVTSSAKQFEKAFSHKSCIHAVKNVINKWFVSGTEVVYIIIVCSSNRDARYSCVNVLALCMCRCKFQCDCVFSLEVVLGCSKHIGFFEFNSMANLIVWQWALCLSAIRDGDRMSVRACSSHRHFPSCVETPKEQDSCSRLVASHRSTIAEAFVAGILVRLSKPCAIATIKEMWFVQFQVPQGGNQRNIFKKRKRPGSFPSVRQRIVVPPRRSERRALATKTVGEAQFCVNHTKHCEIGFLARENKILHTQTDPDAFSTFGLNSFSFAGSLELAVARGMAPAFDDLALEHYRCDSWREPQSFAEKTIAFTVATGRPAACDDLAFDHYRCDFWTRQTINLLHNAEPRASSSGAQHNNDLALDRQRLNECNPNE